MSLKGQTLVKGHTLRNEGAPFNLDGESLGWRTRGAGRGMCSCGIISEMLPSGQARRRWHREHKERVRNGDGT